MKNYGLAALAAALIVACGVIAWMGYERLGAPRSSAPAPVQAITAAPVPSAAATPVPSATIGTAVARPSPSPTHAPVVFVPATAPPSPLPATAGPATPEPLEAGSASPSAAPVPLVTLHPGATMPGIVQQASDAPPRILSLELSTPVARGGDVVSGFVRTSSNVASVEARIAGYSSSMRKIGVGKFVLSYTVPRLPFFLHRTYAIQVIARNTRGDAVTTSLPITIR